MELVQTLPNYLGTWFKKDPNFSYSFSQGKTAILHRKMASLENLKYNIDLLIKGANQFLRLNCSLKGY